ncbi:acyltransferase [Xylophilus sp. GOD-11R]|uniref:acyltransferase family protein n=1 Tax=Xylophilus sp. GOD-11R TaxID=3089814 RepID=UPI00298C59A8|nr:acyltransferase [Xylophilus sp. GOD-11R]WPB58657.1 acyltransferase [Xylophilus sp. GOD-11R]
MQKLNEVTSLAHPETISSRYKSIGGFTTGFDYLRIGLACAVVFQHSFLASYGHSSNSYIWADWHRVFFAPILLMFFALSGFLVAGSLKKNPSVTSFVTLRAVRLVPALAIEILLSALLLGPVLTVLPLSEYFSSKTFYAYFANIVGHIRFFLPGVFLDNPAAKFVNISLWTVPYELECYLALICLWLSGVIKRRAAVVGITAAVILAGTVSAFFEYDHGWANNAPLPRSLIAAFLVGLCINLYADRVRLNWQIACACLAGLILTTVGYQTVYLAAGFAAYIVVYLGMMNPAKKSFLFSGDYSYGLYLFAFPIQQTYSLLFPEHRVWYLNFFFAMVFGLVYAAFSWWVIEKPVLSKKKKIVDYAEQYTSRFEARFQIRRFSR